jgi:hypothetical protein
MKPTAFIFRPINEIRNISHETPRARPLPMGWDQPGFAFSDEEDGVVALKYGNEIFYIAVVRQNFEFTLSGMSYTRPSEVNMVE